MVSPKGPTEIINTRINKDGVTKDVIFSEEFTVDINTGRLKFNGS